MNLRDDASAAPTIISQHDSPIYSTPKENNKNGKQEKYVISS